MPHKDNEVVEYLTPDDARRFLDVVREWPDADVRNMLLVAYFTDMRRGEIFKLEDRDIDFHMKLITIRAPKGGKTSTIGLSKMVENIIREQLEWRSDRFPGRTGGLRTDCSAVDSIKRQAIYPNHSDLFTACGITLGFPWPTAANSP
ncbi:MAG: tyrosine-type recombinase/integrase [Deltaproteobacteria bacterium]|jgi:integrase|nr:tyrosine-type recombinase/integrase [Deltaproteobacteria bacterium]